MNETKTHDKLTRRIFYSIHKNQISEKNKSGFTRIKNLLNCENLKFKKNFFNNKICADFGCGTLGASALNLIELGSKYVHLIDLDKHIIPYINKNLKKFKNKYQIDIGSIEKTPYKSNYFDFILCHGVVHHMDNDVKGLKEIHRTLKKGGKCNLTVSGSGGLIGKFVYEILRSEFKNNSIIRTFLTKIMSGNTKDYERYLLKNYDKESLKIFEFIKKYLDKDWTNTVKDLLLPPKCKTYNEKDLRTLLLKIGFKNIYRIKKKVSFKNIRRLLSPFYYDYDHQISRALYGEGVISLVITKK